MQTRIWDAMREFVKAVPAHECDPELGEVIGTGSLRTGSRLDEAQVTWDRLMPFSEDLWVTSAGRVALRGREAKQVLDG